MSSNKQRKNIRHDRVEYINPSGEKTKSIEVRPDSIAVFDERGYAEQIYTICSNEENWTELTVNYAKLHSIEPVFSGIVISNKRIDISSAGAAILEFSFLGDGLNTIDLEIKNKSKNLTKTISVSSEMIENNTCHIDISSVDSDLLRNVDEIVLCTRPGHFCDANNKVGKFKIRSLAFV